MPTIWRKQRGYRIVNVDSTVILERPKLKDYRLAIRERLAEALGLEIDRVSVKFKTAEKVGPGGRGPLGGIPGDRHPGTSGTK